MANKIIPTKANLLATKAQLAFAKKGYDLLDKKRTVLIKEMMDLNKRATVLQETIEKTFEESYTALEDATITMGSDALYDIAKSTPPEEEYEIISRSVMGVEIPNIKYRKTEVKADYSIHKTTAAFDEASVDMHNITYLIYELAQVEISVFRLAQEIKKTQKRANALNKIQIPKYTRIVTDIENILAEKEREDFFRLKKVKDRKEKQAKEEKLKAKNK